VTWDDGFGGAEPAGHAQSIELVGTHLRLVGTIHLGRFGRLTDFINASRGFVRIHDAQLLTPAGKPTDVALPELMVDQDEISFIAQRGAPATPSDSETAVGFLEPKYESSGALRQPRDYVLFTPGHSIRGKVHVFGQTDVLAFVDASDPHFIPVTDAAMRSLGDAKIATSYEFVLINRKHMIGASEVVSTSGTGRDDTMIGASEIAGIGSGAAAGDGPGDAATLADDHGAREGELRS
jgi:hypothetical protein